MLVAMSSSMAGSSSENSLQAGSGLGESVQERAWVR